MTAKSWPKAELSSIASLGRVAAYVRVSTEEQAEGHSLDSQVDACLQFAQSKEYTGFEVYRDAGFSAKTADRPAFLRLIEDAEAGMVDSVVVFKLDRFARNRLDSLLHKKRLRDAGVKLYSVTESFDEGPSGLIAEGMLELIAEWYSADLKHKVTQGKRKRAEKGLMNGPIPFGYKQDGDPRVDPPQVDEREGAAVRMVYEAYSTGMMTYGAIAERLNAEGFLTRHRAGRKSPDDGPRLWSGDSVRALIQNPVYKGDVTHKGEELPGRHDPIVDEETWNRANRVRTTLRGRATSAGSRFYPLSGIAKCAGCGSNLQGNHSRVGKQHRYYREVARQRRGVSCDKPQIAIRADRLELEVDEIVSRLSTPRIVRERVLELLGEARDVEKEQGSIRERLRRLAILFADLAISEAQYQSERTRLESELLQLEGAAPDAELASAELDVLQLAWSKASPQEKRSLALALFEAVYVDLETMEIASYVLRPAFRPWVRSPDSDS